MKNKKKNFSIKVYADDFAVAADAAIEVLGKFGNSKKSPFKTFLKKGENGKYRAYLDSVSDDNDLGEVIDEDGLYETIDKYINGYETTTNITSFDEDEENFVGTFEVEIPEDVVAEKVDTIPEKIQKVLNNKMNQGIKEEYRQVCEDRVKYMLDNYVNLLDIEDVINYWDVDLINANGNKVPTPYVDPNLEITHKKGRNGVVARAIQAYIVGSATLLKGPKATGKNTCINSIVWLFGDRVEEHTFTQQDSMTDLMASEGTDNSACEQMGTISTSMLAQAEKIRLAHASDPSKPYTKEEDEILLTESLFKQLSAQAGSVHIIHEYRAFARWILDATGHTCFVANELNMADPNLLVGLLHSILDGSITEYDIPGRGLVPLAKHHQIFATMNVGYAGEMEGNPATLSRFGAFELGQPATIIGILHSAVMSDLKKMGITEDLPEKYYEVTEKFYNRCKKAVESGGMTDQCLNVRGIVRALVETKRFEGRTTLNQKLEDEVVTPCDDDERSTLMVLLENTVKC